MKNPDHLKKRFQCLCRWCGEVFLAGMPTAITCPKRECQSASNRLNATNHYYRTKDKKGRHGNQRGKKEQPLEELE